MMKMNCLALSAFALFVYAALASLHSNAIAAPKTELSRKVLTLPTNADKHSVLAVMGPPTHAYIASDLKRLSIDDPNVNYILLWENSPCSAIEVWFGKTGRMNGMDGGQFCGKDLDFLGKEAAKPNKKYSCTTKARQAVCSAR